ncbi:MAG TPA: glycoside hydrolase family 2 TIM barrel-domain containing protein [Candidatus Dormibacteraeota bacterium]|nr:glycoside hydrolase family 2 TIM barrel-domain containing protein [Candidatus Dormibacteraeota bacterium]
MGPEADHPRPNLWREDWASLDGEWEFGAGPKPVFDRRINVPFCPESELSGIGKRVGDVVWYRRHFDAPQAERLLLHFGAVDYWATVWVNEVEVARHEGGHSPFSADITAAVRARDNVVVVRAEDSLEDRTIPRGKQYWKESPEGIFYTAATGIWQTVWLEPVPARYVRRLRLRPDLDSGSVEVAVEGDGDAQVVIRLDGVVVGRLSDGSGVARLEHVEPWSPSSPRLYDVEVTLGADRVESYFGLRVVAAREGRFWLNGEPFTQRLVLDQGYFPGGLLTAPDAGVLRRDVELAKDFGFNGARKHQKAEDPRWLYWADRLGFLVWAEMPSFYEYTPEADRRLCAEWRDLVVRDRDHPCIVAWVAENESFGLDQVEASVRSEFTSRLYRTTHDLDSTRPVVSNDGWEHSASDLCTIHDYSPPADLARRYRSLETALDGAAAGHSIYDPGFHHGGGEPVIVSEFGGLRVAGPGGWGWLEVPDEKAFVESYGHLIDALMQPGPVEGFCYTQLTDVQQEQNGLLTAGREPKVKPELLKPLTEMPKRR